jgi:hypothetical protein
VQRAIVAGVTREYQPADGGGGNGGDGGDGGDGGVGGGSGQKKRERSSPAFTATGGAPNVYSSRLGTLRANRLE